MIFSIQAPPPLCGWCRSQFPKTPEIQPPPGWQHCRIRRKEVIWVGVIDPIPCLVILFLRLRSDCGVSAQVWQTTPCNYALGGCHHHDNGFRDVDIKDVSDIRITHMSGRSHRKWTDVLVTVRSSALSLVLPTTSWLESVIDDTATGNPHTTALDTDPHIYFSLCSLIKLDTGGSRYDKKIARLQGKDPRDDPCWQQAPTGGGGGVRYWHILTVNMALVGDMASGPLTMVFLPGWRGR